MYAWAEDELLVRAISRGVEIKELDGVPTYTAREHDQTPAEAVKRSFPERFTRDRKIFASMQRGHDYCHLPMRSAVSARL